MSDSPVDSDIPVIDLNKNSNEPSKKLNGKIKDIDNFCFFPFLQLLLRPEGVVSPCCWNQQYEVGKISESSLAEIWNGEAMQKLRQEFLDGTPRICKTQMEHIGCHKFTRRKYEDEISLTRVQEELPKRFDVRLNGKCNLQCVMCNVWSKPNGLYNDSDFWVLGPEKIFPYLKEMDVLGGEPFVQKDTYRMINEISRVNPECTWAFVTNAHYKFTPHIKHHLDKIKIRWVQVSIDSLNAETYSKVRIKGDVELSQAGLKSWLDYREERTTEGRGFSFLVSMCVQKNNWKEIEQFLLFANVRKLTPCLQFAYEPSDVSLLSLDREEREKILVSVGFSRFRFGAPMVDPIFLPLRESLL